MAKTLARVLAVPFSMSDCTPFTQAGYIGEDAEVCVQRLLAAANYDVAAAERGIICLDEIDKISTAKVSHGKDVSGEGVQQALLKIIEGTTLQIQAKQEKSARGPGGSSSPINSYPTNSPLSGGTMPPPSSSSSSSGNNSNTTSGPTKAETYNVRTDNILFICAGAFIGLQKIIMNRVAKGSIGFHSPIRSSSSSSNTSATGNKDTTIHVSPNSEESKLFSKHLPFFAPQAPDAAPLTAYNPLDLVEPTDLQTYGLIPELVGRIPVSAALAALDEEALVRVLTEPRNCLVRQYEQLFQLSGVELRFTRGALREIAKGSLEMGTGARGLRTVCERLLTETMFEAPGMFLFFVFLSATSIVFLLSLLPLSPLLWGDTSCITIHAIGPVRHDTTYRSPTSPLTQILTSRLQHQIRSHHRSRRAAKNRTHLPCARPAAQIPCANCGRGGGVG